MERKLNEVLIKRLRKGEVVIKHNSIGYTKEIAEILEYAFPDDDKPFIGTAKYYGMFGLKNRWCGLDGHVARFRVKVLVSDFYKTEINNYEIF